MSNGDKGGLSVLGRALATAAWLQVLSQVRQRWIARTGQPLPSVDQPDFAAQLMALYANDPDAAPEHRHQLRRFLQEFGLSGYE